MLVRLSIRDVLLIDRLDLDLGGGLCVLTGETGAGKSILLDALGLALGRRADSGLVRPGAERASVAAEFEPPAQGPVRDWLAERGLDGDGALVLRRTVAGDGRSRAFVADQPVTVAALAELGDRLIEVYGQHQRMGLMDAATHRRTLDAFGGLEDEAAESASAFAAWREAGEALAAAAAAAEADRRRRDELADALADLDRLAPEAGEEARLAEERALLLAGEKIAAALGEAAQALAAGGRPVEEALRVAQRAVARLPGQVPRRFDELAAAFERAVIETTEATALLDAAGNALDAEPGRLEQVEERLFALRAAARRHRVAVDELPGLRETLAARLAALDAGADSLAGRRAAVARARAGVVGAAQALGRGRARAAERLDRNVAAELAALRLASARFVTRLEPLPEARWGPTGAERVSFEVMTNPGMPPGPLQTVASGGELSRFMLALCVALAGPRPRIKSGGEPGGGTAGVIVFDEIDAGIGGAVADAVGQRLARLARARQVLVVTHQPQVAALADRHFRVAKSTGRGTTVARVEALSPPARREEIARMLAGAEVTEQARAAADSLLRARSGIAEAS
jgi:DNA repair protein RecN (Recombination protein N)